MVEDPEPLGGSLAPDPGSLVDCSGCGWQGPEATVGMGGLDGMALSDGLAPGCPRCGATVAPGLPTIEVIQAARRARDA